MEKFSCENPQVASKYLPLSFWLQLETEISQTFLVALDGLKRYPPVNATREWNFPQFLEADGSTGESFHRLHLWRSSRRASTWTNQHFSLEQNKNIMKHDPHPKRKALDASSIEINLQLKLSYSKKKKNQKVKNQKKN